MFQGSFTIQNTLDVNTILPYCEITGNLTITGAGLTSVALPALRKVGGDIDVTCKDLATFDLDALTESGAIVMLQTALTTLKLGSLATMGGMFQIGSNQLTSVTLPELTTTASGVSITGSALVSVALPKLTFVAGHPGSGVGVVLSGALTSIDLGALTTVMQALSLAMVSGDISLPALTTVAKGFGAYTPGTVSVPLLQQVARLAIKNNALFSAPALKTITGDLLVTDVAAFNMSSVTSVGGNLQLTGAAITTFPAPQIKTIGGILGVSGTKLATLDFPALTSIGSTMAGNFTYALDLDPIGGATPCAAQNANTLLTQLKLPLATSLGPTNGAWIRLGDNPMLPLCRVDAFSTQLKLHGWTGMVTNTPTINPNCHAAAGPCP